MEEVQKRFKILFDELSKVIVGQEEVLKQVMISILCDSHALLESYPGLAKTLSIRTISNVMDMKFSRVQGTPDLLPSDVTGTYIIEEHKGDKVFKFQEGPIFGNILLVDEINRATPKTQAAFLEAMQEKQVTIGDKSYLLPSPFFVLATQNPIEQEGTFNLPEAQTDRFLLKIKVDYPSFQEELEIVNRYAEDNRLPSLKKVFNKESVKYLQELTRKMPIARDLKAYAVKIVSNTRTQKDLIEYGASPRASIGLIMASKAKALLEGRKYVSKKDIDDMAFPILRHRIILNFEAQRNNLTEDDVIKKLLK